MTSTYASAVDWCWSTRWAECKDRDRSRARALACFPDVCPTADAFTVQKAYALRDRLRNLGLSPATVNRHLAAYLAVWGAHLEREREWGVPPSGLYLREPAGRSRVVTWTEYVALTAQLPAPYRGLLHFLWTTGCRVSEALELRPGDVDAANRTVTFRGTKNGDDRTIPVDGRVAGELARAPVGFFAHLSQSAFNHAWAQAKAELGWGGQEDLVPHALRHTAITRWVAAGLPLPVVAKLAGHRSIKTTMRYTHLSTADLTSAMSRAGIL